MRTMGYGTHGMEDGVVATAGRMQLQSRNVFSSRSCLLYFLPPDIPPGPRSALSTGFGLPKPKLHTIVLDWHLFQHRFVEWGLVAVVEDFPAVSGVVFLL